MGGRSKGCGAPQRHERSAGQDQTCRHMTMQRAAVAKACKPCACVRACLRACVRARLVKSQAPPSGKAHQSSANGLAHGCNRCNVAHSLQRGAPVATWAGARERAHTPSARQRGGGWSAPTCACTATASSAARARANSVRTVRERRSTDAARHRCSLRGVRRACCGLLHATCHVGVRRVLLSVVRQVCTVSISIRSVRMRCEAERRDGLTRQRHAACVCDDRMDALQGSGRQLAPEATRTG